MQTFQSDDYFMRIFFSCCIICSVVLSCNQSSTTDAFYQPAEWEPQEAIYMGWDGALEKGDTVHKVYVEIIKAVSEKQKLVLWASSDSLKHNADSILKEHHVPMDNIELAVIPGNKLMWARDISPAFVVNKQGERKAVDFNHTGFFRYRKRYEKFGFDSVRIAKAIANDLKMMQGDSLMAVLKGEKIEKSWMFIEGGAYDVNGKGSLLVGEPFLFRNISPAMRDTLTKEDFEAEFRRTLGVTNVVWLGEGLAEDEGGFVFDGKYTTGGTRGHVDEFARFVNAQTIFLAWVDEDEQDLNGLNKLNFARMRENYQRLLKARDQDGNPFTIIKVPVPDLFTRKRVVSEKEIPDARVKNYYLKMGFKPGDTAYHVGAGSYLNFLITNDKVIIPSYVAGGTSHQKEERVRKIFAQHFPGKKLVFIDSRIVNLGGGGIHCITRHVPAKGR